MVVNAPPQASTSRTTLDTPDAASGSDHPVVSPIEGIAVPDSATADANVNEILPEPAKPVVLSKRAKHRAHLRKKIEQRDVHLAPDMHELKLRSGKAVQVPNRPQPDAFIRKIRLDKGKAMASRPQICDSLVIGLNAVTRYLEETLDAARCELAGLPPTESASHSNRTAKDNLRLFIPTPYHGTRRDRRALKATLDPDAKLKKRQTSRTNMSNNLPEMPPYLTVPRREPALMCALEDMRARFGKIGVPNSSESAFLKITQDISFCLDANDSSEESVGHDDKLSPKNGTYIGEHSHINTEIVQALVYATSSAVSENRDRSILLSLLARFDPEWFRLWNRRTQTLARAHSITVDNSSKLSKSITTFWKAPRKPLQLVFVAKGDINPLHLVQHLLTSVTANNSLNIARRKAAKEADATATEISADNIREYQDIYLVTLSKGAEEKLAGLLALRRVSVLAFTVSIQCMLAFRLTTDTVSRQPNDSPEYNKLVTLVQAHLPQPLSADWLIPAINAANTSSSNQGNLVPAHVKHLQTTAPTDIKALRADRQGEKKRKRQAAQELEQNRKITKKMRSSSSESSMVASGSTSMATPELSGPSNLIDTQPKNA